MFYRFLTMNKVVYSEYMYPIPFCDSLVLDSFLHSISFIKRTLQILQIQAEQ